jgi:ubiquinone/menaquinone biosynthesis C-methylase UbiE
MIKKGDVVIDRGAGAGNAPHRPRETSKTGKVVGIEFTRAMLEKAHANTDKLGFNNVEFRHGDNEKMPVTANTAAEKR